MVRHGNNLKACVIDLKDPTGYNIRVYYRFSNDVTRHYVNWNGTTWYQDPS